MHDHDELMHYGMPRRSGRYPWGSGKEPFQHNGPNLMARAQEFKEANPSWTDVDIAKALNMTTQDLRTLRSCAKDEKYNENRARAYELKSKGWSNNKIAEQLDVSEGTIRNMFKETDDRIARERQQTMDVLEKAVKDKTYVNVSKGTAERLGTTPAKLKDSYYRLAAEGKVSIHNVQIDQLGTNYKTTIQVLAPVDADWKDVVQYYKNGGVIETVDNFREQNGRTIRNIEPPVSIDSKRVKVRYAEEGGVDKDGVIELRRGVDDLSLGKAQYAQVRIAVDGTHYLKGMAMYSDNMPPGVDVVFNTNKHIGTPMISSDKDHSVLKPMKTDPTTGKIDVENPFGATIKPYETLKYAQRYYTDSQGKEHQSAINVVNEQGDWGDWSRTLSSQFLSKQPTTLVTRQLDLTYSDKLSQYEEIKSYTNPIVKKHLLEKFADSCDSDAVYLKASAFPRQGAHVILPDPKMSPTEIYAPNYNTGEKVVLIRYPHAGKFEIPELTVNNNSRSGKSLLKQAPDAVAINPKVASQLSGADFDGDTVMVIPVNRRVRIQTEKPLKGLQDFEPKEVYKGYEGMTRMTNTQQQMGNISNLITDMSLKQAPPKEIERAVKHSMVVIDAEKHGLDYKTSEKQNGISELKLKYQGATNAGASTLISRSKSRYYDNERRPYTKINPDTGEKIYEYTGARKVKRTPEGDWVDNGPKQTRTTKMESTNDARTLLSEHPHATEIAYATYANRMKALGNEARKESLRVPAPEYNATAAQSYSKEVKSLENKLNRVYQQKPLENQAQQIAASNLRAIVSDDPTIRQDYDRLKKVKHQLLEGARYRVGKENTTIHFTDREWDAIQAGAVRTTKARDILMSADNEEVIRRSMPKSTKTLTKAQETRIKGLLSSGNYTQAEIASLLGISVSTVRKYL